MLIPLRLSIVCCMSIVPAAICAQVKGMSAVFGDSSCGSLFDQSSRAKDLHLRKVTMWYTNGCLMGLKVAMDYKGGYKSVSHMFGMAKGKQTSLELGWEEFIIGVDLKGGK
jgi:hypothetical protein